VGVTATAPDRRSARPRTRARNTERYTHLANFVDIVHMPLVIGLVVLGATAWRGPVFVTVLTIVIVLQIALLSCPCMAISGWLRKQHDPNHEPRWSVTVWLYQKYGPAAGIGVFMFFFCAALGVRALIV
jgi:hypothetical protein